MREASAKVVNRLGLHARAAAQLVKLASQFKSRIILFEPLRNVTANAKSLLSILTLSASTGTVVQLKVEGEDEEKAISAVLDLFSGGFGEN